VCGLDLFCCNEAWDELCVAAAGQFAICGCQPEIACGDPLAGECCSTHDGPFCDGAECCAAVCAIDRTCCTLSWDELCVQQAAQQEICGCATEVQCDPQACCFTAHEGTGCGRDSCCATVCAILATCCEASWDAECATLAVDLCCPADLDGTGEVDGGDLGELLTAFGSDLVGADLNCDGIVDSADLGLLLADWGSCGP